MFKSGVSNACFSKFFFSNTVVHDKMLRNHDMGKMIYAVSSADKCKMMENPEYVFRKIKYVKITWFLMTQ